MTLPTRPDSDCDKAATLESGYAWTHRVYECVGMLATLGLGSWFVWRLVHCPGLSALYGFWLPLALLLGLLSADLVSGVVHWGFDTWGKVDTPVLGKLAIRTFRHHHVDKYAITRHDFVETNGHNFTLALLPIVGGLLEVDAKTATFADVFLGMYLASLAFFVSITSQIHKWAHMDTPPRVISWLQRARLILSPAHHEVHHAAPYNRNYCITIGWMNGVLRFFRVFEALEWFITAVTGAIPREDDLGKEEALVVAKPVDAKPVGVLRDDA